MRISDWSSDVCSSDLSARGSMTAQIFDPSTVALLGLGEAGTALARGLVEQSGWRRSPGDNGRRLIAADTALGEGPRGAAIAERAKGFGIAISRDYTDRKSVV